MNAQNTKKTTELKRRLDNLPAPTRRLIAAVRETSRKRRVDAYLVGGFVRDLILERQNLDLDVCVEGDGIAFAGSLASGRGGTFTPHRRFGTATVRLGGRTIDVATARRESYPCPASLPVVTAGSLREDLFRRDFTVNSLAVSLRGGSFGTLIDFFGGTGDLRLGRIRALHSRSFIDDPTRILRGVRFEQRLRFRFEEETLAWLKEAVKAKMLECVEPQRMRDELILLLKEQRPYDCVKRLGRLGGMRFIYPALAVSAGTARLFSSVARQIRSFRGEFPSRRPLDVWLMYFMALLDPLSAQQAEKVCRRFVLRKGEQKRIESYFAVRKSVSARIRAGVGPVALFRLLEPLSYEVILTAAAKSGSTAVQKRIQGFFARHHETRVEVRGEDLIDLGLEPGPRYRRILSRLLDARLNGDVKTKAEELELCRKLIARDRGNCSS